MIANPSFWNDPERARLITQERTSLLNVVDVWEKHEKSLEEIEILIELVSDEEDPETVIEIQQRLKALTKEMEELEISQFFQGENDSKNAIVSIHPGAGGTEAQDWAEMLLRMYLRWAEKRSFDTDILDYQVGEEAGIKSVTLIAKGTYAYGHLKAEMGIHRLVRISPFDTGRRRHTSFASVFVYPEVDDIVVHIDDDDLRIDTYRASGAGGQHVNKTDSAVRITHIPSGIVVQCQNEKSQHRNKSMAMMVLRARLYDYFRSKQEEKIEKLHKEKKEIAWGSQIRSYILQPYRLVKDHRTELEVGNVDAVLDGDIDPFIEAYLIDVS
jgi:peptide chain release factor 2